MADLRVAIAGLELPHPLVLASGPLSWNGAAIVRAHSAGAAAVVTKTISRRAAKPPVPHIARIHCGVLNVERWSDLEPAQWIEDEIPLAKRAGARVIASLGLTPADVAALAVPLEQAGADALEVVCYEAAELPSLVREAVTRVRIPVLAKLPAGVGELEAAALACVAEGASGLSAVDSVGPALRIDVRSRRPLLGTAGWLSGPAVLPLALAAVAALRKAVAVPVIGTGGVETADEALEMLLAGATAVGLCSGPLVRGLGLFRPMREALDRRLDELGFASAAGAVGALAGETPEGARMRLDAAACSACGVCVEVCPYRARRSPGETSDECRTCGLCVSSCPTGALGWEGGRS